MKNSLLFALILLIAAIGGLGLLYLGSNLPDNDLANRNVNAQLLKIDNLDSSVNELSLRSRANLDTNYDLLVRSTVALERAVSDLSLGYFNQEKISGSLLETRFNSFKATAEIKSDQVEDFKSHNSVLRNSEKYAPMVGSQLSLIARENALLDVENLYRQAVIDTLEFAKQGSTKPVGEVSGYADRISQTESVMPQDAAIKILEFSKHVSTAIDAKQKTDGYLGQILNSSLSDQIEDLYNAWSLWQSEQDNSQKVLQYCTIAYVATMLALIGVLAFRLRSLYNNLDQEVDAKAKEIKVAYENLHSSERKLQQSEKMASLGQLVAGVAHEINTPLGYISSNIDTIKLKLNKMVPVLNKVEELSDAASNPSREKTALNTLLKEQIVAFRKIDAGSKPERINTLLKDSTEGLLEIKSIVDSLTNFSHVEDGPLQEVDVNERISSTLKMCANVVGDRKIITNLSDDLPMVSGVHNQILQVFTNIITNAAHATDAQQGVITVETALKDSDVEIAFIDNGSGIDDESLTRVLDPFFTTKEVGEGTGLGLSIAHQIVDAHKGELNISSTVGEGTRVAVLLPVSV